MKEAKILLILILSILFVNLVTPVEIILNKEISGPYNLGDSLEVPVKIASSTNVQGKFLMNILCKGKESVFYQNGVKLSAGEEYSFNPIIIFDKSIVSGLNGTCKLKAILNEDYKLTQSFEVSSLIDIEINLNKTEYVPGDTISLVGEAKTSSGRNVNGFISVKVPNSSYSGNLAFTDSVREGFFSIDLTLPNDFPAGNYPLELNVYEKNFEEEKTNQGQEIVYFDVKQVPTNTEIIVHKSEAKPGEKVSAKAILYDQSGEKINSTAIITVKRGTGEIKERLQEDTGKNIKIDIPRGEKPGKWTVEGESEGKVGKANFKILEHRNLDINIVNDTVVIENIGNVVYNKTIFFRVGNETLTLDLGLAVGEKEEYLLSAPEGMYDVEVSLDEEVYTVNNVPLTGNAISLREASEGLVKLSRHPVVWVFVILLLAIIAFMIFKKGYKKSFIGNFKKSRKNKSVNNKNSQKQGKKDNQEIKTQNQVTGAKSNAHISLSMKGDKQASSVVCLKLKNFDEIFKQDSKGKRNEEGSPSDTIRKITEMAEKYKASVYENNENVFFILAPIRTRTFNNEKPAFNLAQEIKTHLDKHNKHFNKKIVYGIGINYGEIIAKKDGDKIKFMSIGSLIPSVKKVAMVSKGEVLLGQAIKDKFGEKAKMEKVSASNDEFSVYRVKEIRDRQQHSNFINQFVQRQKREANKFKK